jgi:choline dehydrogenase-like flavoprotein
MEAVQRPLNLGTEREWNFFSQPEAHLNGRVLPPAVGRVLGGGSSINVMTYARGHKNDGDFFASEAGDPAWNHESVTRDGSSPALRREDGGNHALKGLALGVVLAVITVYLFSRFQIRQ